MEAQPDPRHRMPFAIDLGTSLSVAGLDPGEVVRWSPQRAGYGRAQVFRLTTALRTSSRARTLRVPLVGSAVFAEPHPSGTTSLPPRAHAGRLPNQRDLIRAIARPMRSTVRGRPWAPKLRVRRAGEHPARLCRRWHRPRTRPRDNATMHRITMISMSFPACSEWQANDGYQLGGIPDRHGNGVVPSLSIPASPRCSIPMRAGASAGTGWLAVARCPSAESAAHQQRQRRTEFGWDLARTPIHHRRVRAKPAVQLFHRQSASRAGAGVLCGQGRRRRYHRPTHAVPASRFGSSTDRCCPLRLRLMIATRGCRFRPSIRSIRDPARLDQ